MLIIFVYAFIRSNVDLLCVNQKSIKTNARVGSNVKSSALCNVTLSI